MGLPLLQQALAGHQRRGQFEFAQRRVQRHLADALARLGRHDEALAMLTTALAAHEAAQPAHRQPTASAPPAHRQPSAATRERLGRLLLDMNRPDAARAQLQRVVDDAAVKSWSHVALAQAGLARAAPLHDDRSAASAHSQAALDTWGRLTGFRDVRMQACLWCVRAAVLAAAGGAAGARTLRDQALAAARRTDAPESLSVTQAANLGL